MKKGQLELINPKTTKIEYTIKIEKINNDFKFVPKKEESGNYYADLTNTCDFCLGELMPKTNREKYRFRVDIKDEQNKDGDYIIIDVGKFLPNIKK